jgi:hypothetical protein
MIGSIGVFILWITLLLLSEIATDPAFCQQPTGGSDQSQSVQNNQMGQQGALAGGYLFIP